jgi:hypothetical protein
VGPVSGIGNRAEQHHGELGRLGIAAQISQHLQPIDAGIITSSSIRSGSRFLTNSRAASPLVTYSPR